MRIPSVLAARTSVSILSWLVVFLILANILLIGGAFYIYDKKVSEMTNTLWIMDRDGNVGYTKAQMGMSVHEREAEYQNHVAKFYTNFYQFDQHTFQGNIERALHLAGSVGDTLYGEYIRDNVLNDLKQRNNVVTVTIEKIEFDMNTYPVYGRVYGIQTSTIGKFSRSRRMDAEFRLKDLMSRTKENPHKAQIITWKIFNSRLINNK